MNLQLSRLRKVAYASVALALAFVALLPGLAQKAHAFPTGSQLQGRSITMSTATPGATGVTYTVAFKPASNYTVKGIIVDFCSGDPLIGNSTCAKPTGFSVGTPTVNASPSFTTTTGGTATNLGGTWTAAQLNTNRTLKLTNATGVALTSGTTYAFSLTTATNPTSAGSFYARVITYTSDTGDIATYAAGTEGSTDAKDYGGIALSANAVINVTAKVMETLSFCVYNASCSDDPSITIGHAVGSATVIDTSVVDTANVNWSLSTNAQSGAVVRMKGDTLKSGSNSIAAAGAASTAFAAGTEKYGLRVSTSGTGITALAPYNGAANNYGLDISTAGENLTTTWGDEVAKTTGPVNASVSTLTFAATASNTTNAGTYTAAEQLVATGVF